MVVVIKEGGSPAPLLAMGLCSLGKAQLSRYRRSYRIKAQLTMLRLPFNIASIDVLIAPIDF